MSKIDRLSLSREEVLRRLSGSFDLKQATTALFGEPTTFNTRERTAFNTKFGLDISKILLENRLRRQAEQKRIEADRIVKCDFCGKEFRNGDHPKSKSSCQRQFCSNECARKFSAAVNKEERRRKISDTLKEFRKTHKHSIRCVKCGDLYEADLWTKEGTGICPECVAKRLWRSCVFKKSQCEQRKDKLLFNYAAVRKVMRCSVCGAERGQCKRPEICKLHSAFKNFVRYLGFDETTIGTERVYDEFDRVRQKLYDMYWVKNMSIPEITDAVGYEHGHGNFIKTLRRFIPLRSPTQGQKLSLTLQVGTDKDDIFQSGSHTAWNDRKVIYRSSYELDLCKELDSGKIDYLVEGLTVDYYDTVLKKTRFAVPDFYLPEFNMIIEVKSSFTFDKQNMLDRANAYVAEGYNFVMEYEHKTYTADEIPGIQEIEKNINYYRKLAV